MRFDGVDNQSLAAYKAAAGTSKFGDFELTDAIRVGPGSDIRPTEGYRFETFRSGKRNVSVLCASVSREKLFDLFLDLLGPLGEDVNVVLETSHDRKDDNHVDLFRDNIDLAVLKSYFVEFEELLLNDGCTGAAVLGNADNVEVQLDDHKLLLVHAHDFRPFQRILHDARVTRKESMRLITEGEHLHSTEPSYRAKFDELRTRIGADVEIEPTEDEEADGAY